MKSKIAKALVVALSVTMASSLVACSSSSSDTKTANEQTKDKGSSTYDTIVSGIIEMNGIFNPLFYKSALDYYAFSPVFSKISSLTDDNQLTDDAGNISYEEIKDESGKTTQTKYTIKLKPDMTFSDGKPVTIDDVIFGYYVMADPNYSGMSTLSSLDIVGLKEYYYDSADYKEKMLKFTQDSKTLSDDDFKAYVEHIVKEQIEENGADTINKELNLGIDSTAKDLEEQVKAKLIEASLADENLKEAAKLEKFNTLKKEYIEANLADGIDVTNISGIEKVDDLTANIIVNGANIVADRQLANNAILPKHYYGVSDDGTEFKKGDMTVPTSRNDKPLGSGPYKFESFENNIVKLSANDSYFKGAPKTPYLKFQVVAEANKVDIVANGEIDITDPSPQKETIERLEAEGIEYNLTDNDGYGYIGVSAKKIPDVNIRKGLMHLMNRAPAINSYYGDLAEVLERPLIATLAEYPQDAKPFYEYNKEKALEFFTKAGYAKNDSGKLVNKKGEQLKVEIGIGSLANHPSAGILSQMKNDMTEFGAEFIISELQFNVLVDRINSGDLEMFALAWGGTTDADLTQIFHSSSVGGAGSNYFGLQSDRVDSLIEEIRVTMDLEDRKALVEDVLDEIMDNAVIMPVYQRKNLNIFNKESLNMDTVYRGDSPYKTYRDSYYTIEMN